MTQRNDAPAQRLQGQANPHHAEFVAAEKDRLCRVQAGLVELQHAVSHPPGTFHQGIVDQLEGLAVARATVGQKQVVLVNDEGVQDVLRLTQVAHGAMQVFEAKIRKLHPGDARLDLGKGFGARQELLAQCRLVGQIGRDREARPAPTVR